MVGVRLHVKGPTYEVAGRHAPGPNHALGSPIEWPTQTAKESWQNRAMARQQKNTLREMRSSASPISNSAVRLAALLLSDFLSFVHVVLGSSR